MRFLRFHPVHNRKNLQADTLKENCVSFGMPAPRLEGVDAIEEDLATTESSWALYKEYSSELRVRWGTTPSQKDRVLSCVEEGKNATKYSRTGTPR